MFILTPVFALMVLHAGFAWERALDVNDYRACHCMFSVWRLATVPLTSGMLTTKAQNLADNVCIYIYIYISKQTEPMNQIRLRMYVYIYMYMMCAHMYIYKIYMYIYIDVYVNIYRSVRKLMSGTPILAHAPLDPSSAALVPRRPRACCQSSARPQAVIVVLYLAALLGGPG